VKKQTRSEKAEETSVEWQPSKVVKKLNGLPFYKKQK
jgi:hypothetical protein